MITSEKSDRGRESIRISNIDNISRNVANNLVQKLMQKWFSWNDKLGPRPAETPRVSPVSIGTEPAIAEMPDW